MFTGKTAIVTGGSRGIGRAIVQALAREGARVVFTYAQNQALADEIANGDTVVALQADVSNFEQAKSLVKQVKERFGRVDILVNNAGIEGLGYVDEHADQGPAADQRAHDHDQCRPAH